MSLPAKRLSLTGFFVACVLFIESLRPVLLPLNIKSQIIFSSIVIAIGYDLGLLLEFAIFKLGFFKIRIKNRKKYLLYSLISIVTIFQTQTFLASQQKYFSTFGILKVTPSWILVILGSILFALIILFFGNLIRIFGKYCAKHVQKSKSRILIYCTVFILTTGLGYLLLIFSIVALQISVDISSRSKPIEQKPTKSVLRSSGQNSLITWEGLGQKGKEFISTENALNDIGFSNNLPIKEMEPIRIYAGIGNEVNLEKRIDLIMKEFERTKAFERSVVVMFTPSGSGWVNPVAVDSVEYITNGNSASVSLQYSDNQPIVQYIKDPKMPGRASMLLFSKIRQRLDNIPATKRPKLFIYGESLGSLGSQEIFKNTPLVDINNNIDGALWVGSPYSGPLWQKLILKHDLKPDNSLVHAVAHSSSLKNDSAKWGPTRIAFLYNATDPIVWSDPDLIFKYPTWLKKPRSPELSPDVRWLPLLTYGHTWFELFSAKNFASGFGHTYDLEIPCALAYVIQANIDKMC